MLSSLIQGRPVLNPATHRTRNNGAAAGLFASGDIHHPWKGRAGALYVVLLTTIRYREFPLRNPAGDRMCAASFGAIGIERQDRLELIGHTPSVAS